MGVGAGPDRPRLAGLVLCAALSLSGAGHGVPAPATAGAAETRAGEDWLASAQRHIAEREYWASESARGLQAPNRAHGLRTYFGPEGVRVHQRDATGEELLSLTLAGWGRSDRLAEVVEGEAASEGARVEIRRPGIVEWYENSPAGLEQGFTLAERPAGAGDLVVDLAVAGATAALRNDEVVLTTATGRRLAYGKLFTVDASGRPLPSRFEVADAGRVRLAIDDAGAAYPVVIDPLLSATSDTILWSAEESFGSTLAAADVNDDGYSDAIIGAPWYDGGEDNEGAVFVFHGSATGIASGPTTTASTHLEPDQPSARLGAGLAGPGDLNGDGFDDLLVGANGGAYVFDGGPGGVASGGLETASAHLVGGWGGVAAAGDVNGDGHRDVLVGPLLFLGSSTGMASGDATTAEANFAFAADWNTAGAGDVNGDGYDDVIVGLPTHDNLKGAAFLYLGRAAGIADDSAAGAAATLEGDQPSGYFGFGVAGIGDVNADGYDDVIVDATNYHWGETNEGAAFLFLGSAVGIGDGGPETASHRIDHPTGYYGAAVAAAGDVNGDGFADAIIGDADAFGYDGVALVFLGSPGGLVGEDPSAAAVTVEFGALWSVASAGDVNADGFDDVLVGGYIEGTGPAATVLHGGEWLGVASLLRSGAMGDLFGLSVNGAGDVNGDGYDDVIVGARGYDGGEDNEGAAFVFHGSPNGVPGGIGTEAARIEGEQSSASLGTSVAGLGDVNGDGYDDVIVAAPNYATSPTTEGAAFVFHGGPAGVGDGSPATAASILGSDHADADTWDLSASRAGDVNGDGFDDAILAFWDVDTVLYAPNSAVLVFYGGPSGIESAGWSTAPTRLQEPGWPSHTAPIASGAGDVNGDGHDDVVVGVPEYSGWPPYGAQPCGAIFLFHGGPGGANGVVASQVQSDESYPCAQLGFGLAVAGAGDVNGDGFGDVIAGSGNWSNATGSAFLFHGGSAGIPSGNHTTAAARLDGVSVETFFSQSVASAGDVNGDGYDDVIVGAPGAYETSSPGAAFVFLGGPVGIGIGTRIRPISAYPVRRRSPRRAGASPRRETWMATASTR